MLKCLATTSVCFDCWSTSLAFLQFLQQYRHYQSNVQIFKLQPDKPNKELAELVMFLAQVSNEPSKIHPSCIILYRITACLVGSLVTSFFRPGCPLLPAAPVHLSTGVVWVVIELSHYLRSRSQNGEKAVFHHLINCNTQWFLVFGVCYILVNLNSLSVSDLLQSSDPSEE